MKSPIETFTNWVKTGKDEGMEKNHKEPVKKMIELILLGILILIGVLWFRNLSNNSNKEQSEFEGESKANKWQTYISILVVSGFFIWLLITNGNLN